MAPEPLTGLSRFVSQVLRHEPWFCELELDDEGWVAVDELLDAVRAAAVRWCDADRSLLERMVAGSSKRRHEVIGDRVRALYGHSLPGRLRKERGEPPAWLFHGTSPFAAEVIVVDGLRPMGRQFVHLSTDRHIAAEVGRRKSSDPVVLSVNAAAAAAATGVPFWIGNEAVWLADCVPARFVSFS
jgi:putative RNA 2'-phosphotransferase